MGILQVARLLTCIAGGHPFKVHCSLFVVHCFPFCEQWTTNSEPKTMNKRNAQLIYGPFLTDI